MTTPFTDADIDYVLDPQQGHTARAAATIELLPHRLLQSCLENVTAAIEDRDHRILDSEAERLHLIALIESEDDELAQKLYTALDESLWLQLREATRERGNLQLKRISLLNQLRWLSQMREPHREGPREMSDPYYRSSPLSRPGNKTSNTTGSRSNGIPIANGESPSPVGQRSNAQYGDSSTSHSDSAQSSPVRARTRQPMTFVELGEASASPTLAIPSSTHDTAHPPRDNNQRLARLRNSFNCQQLQARRHNASRTDLSGGHSPQHPSPRSSSAPAQQVSAATPDRLRMPAIPDLNPNAVFPVDEFSDDSYWGFWRYHEYLLLKDGNSGSGPPGCGPPVSQEELDLNQVSDDSFVNFFLQHNSLGCAWPEPKSRRP